MFSKLIAETPIAVVDFETTGLYAGVDRVVEASVVRIDPGSPPRLVLNSLVNPCRRMAATEIHGITDADVKDAPTFEDIGGHFIKAIDGAVIVSYNVYFDVKFLGDELRRLEINQLPAHLCLMYLRPLLGIGCKCSLQVACEEHGIPVAAAHRSASDASCGASLWAIYLRTMAERGIRTFGDLCELKDYKFLQSIANGVFVAVDTPSPSVRLKPREMPSVATPQDPLRSYWEAVKVALADLEVSDAEATALASLRQELGISVPQFRGVHGKAFSELLAQTLSDRLLDDGEAAELHRLYTCLSRLGWAPGQ